MSVLAIGSVGGKTNRGFIGYRFINEKTLFFTRLTITFSFFCKEVVSETHGSATRLRGSIVAYS
jgi:hypothetical protein